MNYKTHRIGGICAGLLVTGMTFKSPLTIHKALLSGIFIVGSFIGSIIPDIDHPNSHLGKKLNIFSIGINTLYGHRGLTHSPLFALILSIILIFLSSFFYGVPQLLYSQFVIGISVGYFSHLLLDSLTISGIPLLYPLSHKGYRLAKFRTNKHEILVSVICIFFTFITLYILK